MTQVRNGDIFTLTYLLYNDESINENDKQYVHNIVTNDNFVNDPKKFLTSMMEKRGYTEEYRIPEDKVMPLLYKIWNIKLNYELVI